MNRLRILHLLGRDLPSHLAVAWLAISALYFADLQILPEPMIAVALGVVIGLIGAVVADVIGTDEPAAVPSRGRLEPAPSQLGSPPVPSRVRLEPVAVRRPVPPVAVPRDDRTDAPTELPPEPRDSTTPAVDLDRFPSAAADETQCPGCGGFHVNRQPISQGKWQVHCAVCDRTWQLDNSQPPPDVVVRSWIHR